MPDATRRATRFMRRAVFERTSGLTRCEIATLAVWESPERSAVPRDDLRAYYRSIDFDIQTLRARLGVAASLGYQRAPSALQQKTGARELIAGAESLIADEPDKC
jgi:hypothetical protein